MSRKERRAQAAEVKRINRLVTKRGRTRTCGPCTLCCTVLYIKVLNKELWERCEHLGYHDREPLGAGCTIWGEHPEVCKAFRCSWLRGFFDQRDRPDITGLMPMPPLNQGPQLVLFEAWEGALRQPPALDFLLRLGTVPVVKVPYGSVDVKTDKEDSDG